MAQIELIPFIPETAAYQIWHPKDFLVKEDKDGIVTITSPVTDSNLTLSAYQANQIVTEEILLSFYKDATEDYTPLSEVRSKVTKDKIWFEGEFQKDNVFWVWSALSHLNQIVLASINSEEKLSKEDFSLYIFMLDKMEIYPSEDD